MYCFFYFHVLYDVGGEERAWSYSLFAAILFQCTLLYLSAGLILPLKIDAESDSLSVAFEKNGRWAVAPLGMLMASALLTNRIHNPEGDFFISDIINSVLAACIAIYLLVRNDLARTSMLAATIALSIYGWLYVWSGPGRF
jgi:Ca2+/Na+ antiporter